MMKALTKPLRSSSACLAVRSSALDEGSLEEED